MTIKKLREKAGLTQLELAVLAECTELTIKNIEDGSITSDRQFDIRLRKILMDTIQANRPYPEMKIEQFSYDYFAIK